MYQKILVPLDGSQLAESVLPHVELMVEAGTKEVVLTTVTELIDARSYKVRIAPEGQTLPPLVPVVKMPAAVGKMQRQGERYLNRVAKKLTKKGADVRTRVLLGNPAEEITSLAEEEGVDLIVLSSRGRSGHNRWALGSISDKMLRASQVPLLLVKPGEE